MDLLEKLLVDLHSSIDNEESKIDCVSLVANIEAIALAEMEPADLEYTTSLLFSSISPPSLLMFLEDSSRSKDKEIVSAKKNALKFLAQFIKVMPYMVDKTGPEIFKTLLTLFKKETSGEVKSCLLLPAKNLLRNANIATAFETENSELPVESVYKILLDELHQSASKVGKGLRCEALKTLGLLVFAFPVHPATVQSISPILILCENALQQNFSKSCKDPDFSAISGAFSCLDRCLVQFEEKYTNNAELWKFLLQAVMATTSSDTSRYSACNKAVRLISHHAELFGQLIGHNAGTSYNLLYSMHSAGKKSMMKHSSNALYTVLRQIAVFVVNNSSTNNSGGSGSASTDAADAVRTLEKLYTEYMNILLNGTNPTTTTTNSNTTTNNTSTSTSTDSSVVQQEGLMHAVQGLAAIAPAVVTLFNNTNNNNSITSAGSRSVTGTVLSIIEAAQHYCRFAESAATTTSQDTNTTPDNTTSTNTNTTTDNSTTDVVTDNTNMYETLTVKHKKVLFLMAVTSFVSAVSTHTSTTNTAHATTGISTTLQFTSVIVQFIQEYVVDSIVCYSRFWSKQQVQVCSTLCTLSHALMTLSYHHTNDATATTNTSTSTTTDPTTLYSSLLHCISHTLLLRTVSRTTLHESVNPSQARLSLYTLQPEDRLLYAYIDLWTELLYPANKHTNALLMRYYSPSYNTHFAERLYDMLFTQVLSMLNTLDLRYDNISSSSSTNTNTTNTTNTANDITIIPTNIADQDILLNLIAFLQLLLPQCEAHFNNRCSVWFSMIVNRIVVLAEQYPLISALYRLLRCILSVCGSVTSVVDNPLHTSTSDSSINSTNSNSMDIVTTNNTTPNNTTTSNNECILTLKSFMLSLQQRIHTSSEHYHYELLDAIICLILSSHRILTIKDIITTLRMSLLTGVQALLSVQLLTEYTLHNNTLLLPYLPTLHPLFDSYLTVNTNSSDSSGKMYLKSAANSNKMKKNKPTTSTTNTVSTTTTTTTSSDDTDTTLQIAILRLLGRLGGNNKHLVTPAEHTIQDMIVWSEREVVSVDVPLGAADGQLRVCLDVILPRIVALCTTGTNTSTSTSSITSTSTGSGSSGDSGVDAQCVSAAAETLHAIILYMVGCASSISGSRDKTTLYTSTYEHLFPVVIQLAVSELACGVVYRELLFQLVRWFSGHNQVHEKDTLALLDALFNKLSDPAAESSVRDLCANGIVEFFVWAIKQSTKAQFAKHPGSVESILERVCVLISHPQASQRTAAVILLRKLYPSFREESNVVHKYTLRVIYLLSKSMRLYDHTTTQQEISAVLLKYEKMVVVTVVDRDDSARLVSPADDRGYPSSLADLVYELYTHALTSDTILHRRQCMRSFSALAPLLSGSSGSSGGNRGQVGSTSTEAAQLNGVQSFLLNLVSKHNKQSSTSNMSTVAGVLVSTIEGSGSSGSSVIPTLHNGSSANAILAYTTYMRSFIAKLDSYNWLIKMNYVSVLDILMYNSNTSSSASNKKRKSGIEEPAVCSVLNSISTYLSNYANDEIYLGSTSDNDSSAVYSVRREALYRVIILLSNVFASVRTLPWADQSSVVTLLRDSGVYCDALHTIIANTLLPTTHTTHTTNTDYDIYYATQLLYTQVKYDLTLVYECSSIYTTTVNQYINVVLDSTSDGTLTTQQLYCLIQFYNTIKKCNMLTIVFGGNHSVENVKFAVSILTNILTSIHTTSKTTTTLTTANNTTSTSTNTTPLAISLGAAALELCVSMGLALAHTTTSDTDVPTLLQLLTDPVICSVLLLHYQDTVVTLLTSTNTNLSLVDSNNLQQYVHTAYNFSTGAIDNYTMHLRTLFPTILSVLTAQLIAQASNTTDNTTTSIRTNDTINTLLTVCTEHNICNLLPDNIILLLLEAATHTTGTATNISSINKLHEYVLNSCIHAFNGKYKPPTTTATTATTNATTTSATTLVDYIIIRLKWLPYVIPGTVQGTPLPYSTFYTTTSTTSTTSVVISKQAELADSLEELAATHFPLHSHSIQVSSVEGRQYFKLLQAYLQCFIQTGSVVLLAPLVPSLREGKGHKYYGMICNAFSSVTSSIAVDEYTSSTSTRIDNSMQYVSIMVLASYTAKHILDPYQDQIVKHVLFNHILIPTLLRCPSQALVHIYTTTSTTTTANNTSNIQFSFSDTSTECIVKQLTDIIVTDPFVLSQKSGTDAAAALLYVQSCAYRLLEVVYDRVPLNTIKTTVTQSFAGPGASGKELTQHICRAAHKQLRAPKLTIYTNTTTTNTSTTNTADSLYATLYSNAYRCLAIVVAKTQTEEQFFDTFLFKEKPDETVWERVVGEHTLNENNIVVNNNVCSSVSGRFATVAIGSSNVEQSSVQNRNNRLRNVNASAVGGTNILSQYLKGSIVDSSSASQVYDGSVGNSNTISSKTRSDFSSNSSTLQQMNNVLHKDEYTVSQYSYTKHPSSTYNPSYTTPTTGTSDTVQGLDDHTIYLEMNHINAVPAMACMVRVITRMDVLFAHKWYTDPTTTNNITTYSEASMPKWLVECRDKISTVGSIGQSGNVRLFVLRLFMNQPVASIISGYMEFILPGVLNCVLYDLCNIDPHTSQPITNTTNGTNSTPSKGSCYSYTLRDFVFTLTDTWRCKPTTYCTTQATLLLNYLLHHLYDSDPDILKENVLSVKSLLSLWLPYTTASNTSSTTSTTSTTPAYTMHLVLTPLLTLLNSAYYGTGGAHASASSRGSDSVRRRLAGLEIVKHLLQCGYPLLETAYNTSTSSGTGSTQMLTSILDCIKFPRKEVIQAACEVAGLLLQSIVHYSTTNTTYKLLPECTTFHAAVQATIDKKALEKGGSDIVATCMRYVSVYYTDFVSREMLMKTVYNVGRLSARSKYEYLDMLCVSTSTTTMSDVSIVNDILKPHLLSFLADLTTIVYGRGKYTLRLPMVCINTLVLLTKHIDTVSIDVIESVLGGSSTEGVMLCVGGSSVVQVRDAAYKMLLALWRTRLADTSGSGGDNSRLLVLRKRVLQLLLNGLRDKDTIGMNTSPISNTTTATNTTNTTASDTTLYHNPYHWSDDNTARIGIRKQVFAFFQSTLAQQGYGLSTTITQRLHTLMCELYDPVQCSQWLQYSSFLILVLGSESASYNSALFKHSLADNSTYSAMTVNTAISNSNTVNSMTPLFSLERTSQVVSQYSQQSGVGSGASGSMNMNNFTASQNYLMSQSARGNGTDPFTQSVDGAGLGERRKGYVRGTQQFSWTQTQQYATTPNVSAEGSGTRANSGSGSSSTSGASKRSGAYVDMASTQYNAFSSMMNTQRLSSTNTNTNTSTATATSSNTTTNTSNTQLMPPPTTLPTRYITTQRVPIRFSLKHTSATSTTTSSTINNTTNASEGSMINRAAKYASVAAMQASVKMAEHRKQTNKSKQRVVVYRKYRTGELPDINITLSDVLNPLQSLCLYDENCAGLVFGVLYDAQYKLHLHSSSDSSTSTANTTTSASTDVVYSMCADLHTMLQSARVTGATNTTLYATLLRRSAHKLTLCIDHALHTTPIPPPTATAGISRGRARPAPTTTITTTTPTIAPALLLPAELIAECALQSCNYHTGMQLLEQQLLLLDKASVQVVSSIVDSSVTIAGSSNGASGSGANNTTQLVTVNASTASKKRNIQASLESDSESVISTATANNTTGKRTRKSKTDAALPTTDNTANKTSTNTNMEVVAEDEATQQAEGLTADELLDNMSSANASAGSGGRRSYRNTTVAHTPNTTSTTTNTHATNNTTASSTTLTVLQQSTLSHTRKSIWFQLYRLYDSIGEKHILLGLTAKLGEHTVSNADTGTNNTTASNTTSTTTSNDDSVCMDSVQRSILTKRALDAELSGDYVEAVRIYALLNEQADTIGRSIVNANPTGSLGNSSGSIGKNDTAHTKTSSIVSDVTQNERDLWDERSLLCLKQLCDWQQLYDCVEKITRISTLHSTTTEDNRPVWEILSTLNSANPAQNRLKERLLPHYLHSLLHLSSGGSIVNSNGDGSVDSITQTRDNFLERVLSYQPTHMTNTTTSTNTSNLYELRQYLESHFPTELALYSASCGQYARSRVYSEQAMQRFVAQWRSMHPCATQARCQLLQQLQPILELRDAADYNSAIDLNTINSNVVGSTGSSSGRGVSNSVVHKLTHLLDKWSISSPSTNTDDVSHWADVNCVRATALYPTLQQYNNTTTTITGSSTSTSSPIDNPFLRAKLQLAALHVSTAAAAVQQGVLSAVKTQLECNNAIRRQVFGKKALLTMPEVQVVYHYNSRSIDRLSSGTSSGAGGTSSGSSTETSTNDAYAQIESMFTKTMSLLDKKAQLLSENRQSHSGGASGNYGSSGSSGSSGAMDTLQLSLLRADWLVKWSNSISTNSSISTSTSTDRNSRVLDALTLYEQCSCSADTILRTTNTTNTTTTSNIGNIGERSRLKELQQHLCSSYTQHMDYMLQYFERTPQNSTLADDYVTLTNTTTKTTSTTNPRILAAIQTVRCFVQGLKLGNSYCIQRVLRLVQIIGQYSTYTQDILQSQLHSIPAWVFLQYAAQLMGSLDRPEGAVISRILEYTATTYPNALYYPYRITSEFLGTNGRANSSRLTSLIDSPLQDSMIQALGGLTHPEHRLSDCWKEIDTVYRNNTSTGGKSSSSDVLDEMSKHKVQAVYNKIKTTILDSEWSSVGDKIGTYNKYFARAAKPIVEKICGCSGEKLYTGTVVQCKKVLEAVRDAISNSKLGNMQFTGGKIALSEFSQYLCDFDPLLCRIEVPGQYSKYNSSTSSSTSSNVCAIPNLSTHEYITSIDPTLLVMSSIRKPKRITLYGSSGGVYMFLVKGGEDLRNDERIQQLFMLMNSVVNSNSGSSNSSSIGDGLRARTYAVIPMTSQVGILEWVPNTTPLKDIISTEMGKDPLLLQLNPQALSDNEVDLMRLNAYEKRLLWVKSHNYTDYHKMYQRANRAQAMDMYTHITSELSDDYIRRRFVNMAHTAEAYLTIRDQFAKSLAVSSLFGYILGIGDRHLENLLIDLTTGSVIQIDFGICFGMGSSVLQVPELLPFRLTPQLRGVLRPLDGVGLLRHYMVLCLQALRADAGSGGSGWSNSSSAAGDNAGSAAATSSSKSKTKASTTTTTTTELPASYSGIIPNALEVYLNDPVVDWLKGAANKSNKDSERAKTASGSSSSGTGVGAAKGKSGTRSAEELAEASAASAREEWTERREDLTWEPRRRVHAAVGKILGADPVSVLVRDLGVNPWVAREKSLAALTAIVSNSANAGLGGGGNSSSDSGSSGNSDSGSSGSEDRVLSVGQQVDKLINLATDGDVLVRQWGGLQTWL